MNLSPITITPGNGALGIIGESSSFAGHQNATSQTLTANQLLFYPFVLTDFFVIQKAFWYNGAAVSGNVDVGVYLPDGTRLCSVGSTAQAGTNAIQSAALSYQLPPGKYLLAFGSDSTGALFGNAPSSRSMFGGTFQQSSGWSSGLPASATFANLNGGYLHVFGLCRRSVV